MKRILVNLLVCLPLGVACMGQEDVRSVERFVSESGPHDQVWETVTIRVNDEGEEVEETSSFVQLTTGLNRWDEETREWLPASDEIEIVENAGVARGTQHKVIFAGNLNEEVGTINLLTPEGLRLRSRIVGVAYRDWSADESAFIGEIQDSDGEIHGGNMVIYPNAFDAIDADVRYRNFLYGLEQDVIFRTQLPPPEDYGMDSTTTYIEVWTQFFEAPAPDREVRGLPRHGDRVDRDESLYFGEMSIVPGRAFAVGEEHANTGTAVAKEWVELEGRTFLIESVPFVEVRENLRQLPENERAAVDREKVTEALAKSRGDSRAIAAESKRRMPISLKSGDSDQAAISREKGAMVVAQAANERPGFLIDYSVVTSATNFTFRSDITYYISGTVNLSGATTFEGGTVIKYDNTLATKISILGTIAFLSEMYRPVVMTAKHDNTVGDLVAAGTPSGFYANPALVLNGGNTTNGYTLTNFRISHARLGIEAMYNSTYGGHTFKHFQILNSHKGFKLYVVETRLFNGLMFNVATNFDSPYYSTNYLQHVTSDTASHFQYAPTVTTFSLNNCLLTAVGNQGSWGGSGNVNLGSSSGVYETVGAGAHYLAAGSPYRNSGVTGIDTTLKAELGKMTTHAPIVLTSPIVLNTVLYPQAVRDTDTPDVGYHYAPLDYAAGSVAISGATLTLTNGVAVGVYGETGFRLEAGARLTGEGTPLALNQIVRYHAVQEVANTSWHSGTGWTLFKEDLSSGTAPEVRLRFTEMPLLADSGKHFSSGGKIGLLALTDCQLSGGMIELQTAGTYTRTAALTNSLFHRVSVRLGNGTDSTLIAHAWNNLFLMSTNLSLNPATGNAWQWKDNAFDNSVLAMNGKTISNSGYNGYINNSGRIMPTNANDVVVASFTYFSSTLGKHYQSSTNFVDKGSRTGGAAGLFHYTASSATTKEQNTQVDIGFHYVAVTSGLPTDTDGDGVPDYLEDRNGNGTHDSGETNWQSSNGVGPGAAAIMVFTPLQN